MESDTPAPSVRPRTALLSILGFWLFYTLIVSFRASVLDFPNQGELAVRRAVVGLAGVAISWALYLVLRRFDRHPLGTRIAVAFGAAVPCAILIAAFNYYLFNVYDAASLIDDRRAAIFGPQLGWAKEIAESAISRYFFLAAWAALYLALSYAGEVRSAERRAAHYARAAQAAEIRALRYQVNPHFLFNTLNSLSSLVMSGRAGEAETMIINLATFFRTSLTGDAGEDVRLDEEVRLQQLYLDIEGVRFPERLVTVIDLPDTLADACVPGLILQPLVENAIKYGVSRASRPVTLTIAAAERGGLLSLTVADDGNGPPREGPGEGGGIGLANVRDRLAARFGEAAGLVVHAPARGGFTATISLPLNRDGC